MNAATQLIAQTRKSAEAGKNTLERVLPMIQDRDLKNVVSAQHDEYTRFMMSASTLMRTATNDNPEGVSGISKIVDNVTIAFNTLTDKSASNISQVVIDTNEKAISELDNALTSFGSSASPEAYNLASTMRDFLYRNRRELQRFCS